MFLSKPNLLLPLQISFIAAMFFMLLLANKVHSQDSICFTYDSFSPEPGALTYQRDAHVPSGSRFLSLTRTDASENPQPGSVGRVLFSTSVRFWERATLRQASFETTIKFRVRASRNGAANGLAFFIAPVNFPIGSDGRNFGIFDSSGQASRVFAVEFDTNPNDPEDPYYDHIGIDIESRFSKNSTRLANVRGRMATARIKYDAPTRLISVHAPAGSKNSTVTYEYDLKKILPQLVQVGISSSTGSTVDVSGIFEIHSWSFTSTLVDDPYGYNVQNNNSGIEDTYIRQHV